MHDKRLEYYRENYKLLLFIEISLLSDLCCNNDDDDDDDNNNNNNNNNNKMMPSVELQLGGLS
jgi:hypothetical protein